MIGLVDLKSHDTGLDWFDHAGWFKLKSLLIWPANSITDNKEEALFIFAQK